VEIEQLIENFVSEDPDLYIPVLVGVALVVGGLLIGLFRGMTGGILVALLIGAMMTLSPVWLETLDRQAGLTEPEAPDSRRIEAEVARGAAQLSVLNSEMVEDLTRVINSMRSALVGLEPVLAAQAATGEGEEGETDDGAPETAQQFTANLTTAGTEVDDALENLSEMNQVRAALQSSIRELDALLASPAYNGENTQ